MIESVLMLFATTIMVVLFFASPAIMLVGMFYLLFKIEHWFKRRREVKWKTEDKSLDC
jgi:uncharacterized protein HemY